MEGGSPRLMGLRSLGLWAAAITVGTRGGLWALGLKSGTISGAGLGLASPMFCGRLLG